jgi:hypothetical protein
MSTNDKDFISDEEKVVFSTSTNSEVEEVIIESKKINEKISDDTFSEKPLAKKSAKNSKKGIIDKPVKKSIIKRFSIYTIMTLLTFGIWSRFKPLRENVQGSWFIFALFMLIINGFLVTERFFKNEFNAKITEKFGENAVVIPKKLFFEEITENVDYKSKYEDTLIKIKEASDEISKLNKRINITESDESLSSESAQLINDKLIDSEGKLTQLKLILSEKSNELENLRNKPIVAPNMAFLSFNELDSIVGCSSKFAERKKKDIYSDDYHNKWVKFNMIISKINEGSIELKNAEGVSLVVDLSSQGSGYDLLVDDKIDVTFTLNGLGSCDNSYTGTNGKINF